MCGSNSNDPPAMGSKDAVAVIHPTPGGKNGAFTYRLRLSNPGPEDAYTEVFPDQMFTPSLEDCEVRIHKYCQLGDSSTADGACIENPVLKQFMIDDKLSTPTAGQRLGLYTGDGGVIGRMISVERYGKRVGEGVIGWHS